jgi:hypothetical protein
MPMCKIAFTSQKILVIFEHRYDDDKEKVCALQRFANEGKN